MNEKAAVGCVAVIFITFAIGGAIYDACSYQSGMEACKAGNTLDCQIAVQDTNGGWKSSRYKTAYKDATGRDLPPMEK